MPLSASPKYKAFISYAHADEAWARWLHRNLEYYQPPKNLKTEKTLKPIFRERDDLSSSGTLDDSLTTALAESAALIVICSPAAAASKWVRLEIESFKKQNPERPIFSVIVDGNPPDCFPDILRRTEPLAADARKVGDGRKDALLKIAAGLLEVDFDALKQRDLNRRNRRLLIFSTLTCVGLIATSTLAIYALFARNEALRQAQIATVTTDFVVDVFKVADPSEARGQAITAKEILDRGTERVNDRMGPEVQGRLLQTLGRVYNGLGLYNRAATLLGQANQLHDEWETKIALADTQFMQGNYDVASQSFRRLIEQHEGDWDLISARLHNGLGDTLNYAGEPKAAIAQLTPTLEANLATFSEEHEATAHTLSSLASAYYFAGQLDRARELYKQAYNAAANSVGEFHPSTITLLNDLANINYVTNNLSLALQGYQQALPYYEKVFGEGHPEVATIRNNIGRILFETNRNEESAEWLLKAADTFETLALQRHPTLVHLYNTLGLALKGSGDMAGALDALQKAAERAQQTEHLLLGPILVELADIYCRQGKPRQGQELLTLAEPKILALSEQSWRLAIANSVRMGCLGESTNTSLMTSTLTEIRDHFGPDHPFTRDAETRISNLTP